MESRDEYNKKAETDSESPSPLGEQVLDVLLFGQEVRIGM